MAAKILRNAAKCSVCGDLLESTHRYDYQKCACGNLRVDGGTEYIRRGLRDGRNSFVEMSVFQESEDEKT